MKRIAAALVLLALTACGAPANPVRQQVLKHEQLIADCMHRNGFEYVVAVPPDLAVQEARRAGKDLEQAIAERPANPNDDLLTKLPPDKQIAWGDALYGTDGKTGCFDETYKTAWGKDLDALSQKAEQLVAKVKADPGVEQALKIYVECMRDKGFSVRDPDGVYELGEKADPAHKVCVEPYDKVYDEAYLKHSR